MNSKLKITLWIGGILIIGAGIPIAVYGFKRSAIRKRLEEAYHHPSSVEAVGGFNKLAALGLFDRRLHQNAEKATISKVEARDRAQQIWDNYGAYFWSSSNTSAILGAFEGLGHQHDVSKISDEFYQNYKEDLQTVIETVFEESDQKHLLVDKLMRLPNH